MNITTSNENYFSDRHPRKKEPCAVEQCQECERPGDRYNMGSFYVFFCEFHAGFYALRLMRYAVEGRF